VAAGPPPPPPPRMLHYPISRHATSRLPAKNLLALAAAPRITSQCFVRGVWKCDSSHHQQIHKNLFNDFWCDCFLQCHRKNIWMKCSTISVICLEIWLVSCLCFEPNLNKRRCDSQLNVAWRMWVRHWRLLLSVKYKLSWLSYEFHRWMHRR